MTPAEINRNLTEFINSPGWGLLLEALMAERERAIRLLANPKANEHEKAEHDFLRGCIYAIDKAIGAPQTLKDRIAVEDRLKAPDEPEARTTH